MSKNSSNDGIGFLGLLGIAFVILKLTGFINWSWWYVTLPLLCPIAFFIFGLLIYLFLFFIQSNEMKIK